MSEFVFITDRTQEDIDKIKSGKVSVNDNEAWNRASLTLDTFSRWSDILWELGWSCSIPSTPRGYINASREDSISNLPEGVSNFGRNFAYHMWFGIDLLIESNPEAYASEDAPDLTNFPKNMDNLTFENVNVLERVMKYAIEHGLKVSI